MSALSFLGKMLIEATPFIDTARDSSFPEAPWFASMELKSNPGLILLNSIKYIYPIQRNFWL